MDVLDNILGTSYIVSVWEDQPTSNRIHVCVVDIGKGYNAGTYAEFEAALIALQPGPDACEFDPSTTVSNIIILGVERQ